MELTPLEKLKSKFIFSIEGNIGSGKTTIISHLKRLYKDVLVVEEPVKDWQNIEGSNLLQMKNENMPRWGYSFEAYVLITKMNELTKAANSDAKVILIERCMLTDKAFFDVNAANNLCNPMEVAMFNNLFEFLSSNVYPKLNGIIYLDTPVEVCIERIKQRGRKEENTLSGEYLTQLDETFRKVIKESGVNTLYLNGVYDINTEIDIIEGQLRDFVNKSCEPESNNEDKEKEEKNRE